MSYDVIDVIEDWDMDYLLGRALELIQKANELDNGDQAKADCLSDAVCYIERAKSRVCPRPPENVPPLEGYSCECSCECEPNDAGSSEEDPEGESESENEESEDEAQPETDAETEDTEVFATVSMGGVSMRGLRRLLRSGRAERP